MKLHYNLFSPNCRKVALMAAYVGAKIERVTVNVPAGGTETPEYLAINPNGLIPALEDGDFKLWESNAIMQYIAEKEGAWEVWPKEPKSRGLVSQWQFWEANHFGRAVMMLGYENFMKKIISGGGPDAETVATYLEFFKTHAQVMNGQLAKTAFLAGDKPTLADFACAGAMQFAPVANVPFGAFSNLVRWFDTMRGLEAWKQTEPRLPK